MRTFQTIEVLESQLGQSYKYFLNSQVNYVLNLDDENRWLLPTDAISSLPSPAESMRRASGAFFEFKCTAASMLLVYFDVRATDCNSVPCEEL